jgi:hypothetical protein
LRLVLGADLVGAQGELLLAAAVIGNSAGGAPALDEESRHAEVFQIRLADPALAQALAATLQQVAWARSAELAPVALSAALAALIPDLSKVMNVRERMAKQNLLQEQGVVAAVCRHLKASGSDPRVTAQLYTLLGLLIQGNATAQRILSGMVCHRCA